jgi:hypothetical protein
MPVFYWFDAVVPRLLTQSGAIPPSFIEVSKSFGEVSKPSRERAQSSKEGLPEALRGF